MCLLAVALIHMQLCCMAMQHDTSYFQIITVLKHVEIRFANAENYRIAASVLRKAGSCQASCALTQHVVYRQIR